MLLGLVLIGCASLNPEKGFAPVQALGKDKLDKDLRWSRTDEDRQQVDRRVAELLEQALGADAAVQVALLNNRGLQAAFEQLGIGDAERVQASQLPNPGFSFGRLRRGDEVELERGLHVNVARLLSLPLLKRAEERRLEQTQADVAAQVVALAGQTRRAWIDAVAAEQALRYTQQVQQTADASAELARRMAQVGNFNKLQQLREQSFSADAAQNLARAQRARLAARERLTRLLGLWGTQAQFTLPERLPDLPNDPRDLPDLERTAMSQRLDVLAAKRMAEQTASNLGLTRTTRFINVLELGLVRNSSNEAPAQRGYEISLELPLFDWGGARVERAEAVYRQALHRAADTAINARSEVREAYGAYRSAWDIAKHQRDEVLPLRQRIAEENLLRYNGMLIGVFELLADARSQIAAVNTSIDALREFWLAQADLDIALLGKPSLAPTAAAAMTAEAGGGAAH
ncbi:TolC family protein [Pseudaquabacterium terrae]|nr:TolC family protein [Aquabacterium terrae]